MPFMPESPTMAAADKQFASLGPSKGLLGPRVGPYSLFLGSGSLIKSFKPKRAPFLFLVFSWVWLQRFRSGLGLLGFRAFRV